MSILLYELCYLKCKVEILNNHYLVVYFPLIVSANWELRARLQEMIVSQQYSMTICASTKKKQAHVYSLGCLLADMHGSWTLLFHVIQVLFKGLLGC